MAQPTQTPWTLLTPLNNNLNVYYDAHSITTTSSSTNHKKIHLLFQETAKSAENTSTSILAITIIDCNNMTGKIESLLFFNLPWAQGEQTTTNSEVNNTPSIALNRENAYDQKLIEIACKQ